MYQLGIIGGGPAGYVAAERAGQKGLKVVIFEAKDLGGVCLNEGCIPTKSFLYSAKLYDQAKGGSKYGILNEGVGFDYDKILKRKNKIVKKMVGSVGAKMKHNHVDVVKGQAIIKGRKDGVIMVESGEDTYQLENLLICTGSESAIPPIPGLSLSSDYLLTNREALQLDSLPESLTVIGGGVIGLEFASFFNSMGVSVTVIEMLDEILMGMDKELSSELRKQFEKKGINFHLSSKVTKVDGGLVHFESNGEVRSISSEKILVSTGRRPVVEGFGLENLGVELFKGGIKVNEKMATNIPNVYAAGDVTGFSLLAHTASREGEVVVNNLTGRKDHMRYNAIPGVVYTNPEFSGVGLTEEAAKAKKIEYDVVKLPMAYAGRFTIENEGGSGFIKLLLGKKYKEVLGVHMLGNPSSEMIYGAVMAVEMEMTQEQLQEIVFPHPTVSEIFKEALFV
ncbi:dihydrolipoyl dehydrogenase [Marinilabilia rubra]|uniref:Dihydrolipoyl dehydrogenase n=1 Tax=Marinilabilia rubra TaxID=2162893 RepID=A0A2U2B5X6_9BACT|nr:dihydrolipoyl dehydrogenase [Marinilabilia rubra]PWD98480.1 dihydrolipoyl dehydrogenase [Marinilabilia rubra]